jgi:hypothetical protein
MRGKGINYDTGFLPGNHDSRPVFDQAVVAAQAAAAEGLEVWFAPFSSRADHGRPDRTVPRLHGPGRAPAARGRQGRTGDRLRAEPVQPRLPKRLNAFLAEAADAARGRFGGPLTYAAGTWEPVDWSRFDIVSVDV